MAYENGKSYWFLSYGGSGRALSVYGNSQVSQNRNVILWDKQVIDDQSWYVGTYPISGFVRIRTDLDQRYGLNVWRGADNYYNCDICMITGNEEDSKLDFITVNGNENLYRVKLLKEDMYLTAMGTGNGADVRWKALTRNDDQLWKLVEFTGSTPDPDPGSGSYQWPTESNRVTQSYSTNHRGIDVGGVNEGVKGDPIYAWADGKIARVLTYNGNDPSLGDNRSMGNCIFLHSNNPDKSKNGNAYIRTLYMHMDRFAKTWNVNESVKKGTILGYMGNTGNARGVHLHFGMQADNMNYAPGSGYYAYEEKNWIDPMIYF